MLTLSSGEMIEIEAFTKLYLPSEDRWVFILNYLTNSIEDEKLLRKKSELIWETFKPMVVKNGFKAAAIKAIKYTNHDKGVIIETSRSKGFTFVFVQSADGEWKFL